MAVSSVEIVNYTGGGHIQEDPEVGFVGERADYLKCGLSANCKVFQTGRGKLPEGCPGRKIVYDRVVANYLRTYKSSGTPVFTYDSCSKA